MTRCACQGMVDFEIAGLPAESAEVQDRVRSDAQDLQTTCKAKIF